MGRSFSSSILAPTPASGAAGRGTLVDQQQGGAAEANRPSISPRPASARAQVAAEIDDGVQPQRLGQPIRHPSLRDPAEVEAAPQLHACFAVTELEHVGQRKQRTETFERGDSRALDEWTRVATP